MYVLWMDGMKVRVFNNHDKACEYGELHCKFAKWKVTSLVECAMPSAEKDTELYADERATRNYAFYNGVTVRTV